MNSAEFMRNLNEIEFLDSAIKLNFIIIFCFSTFIKIIHIKEVKNYKIILNYIIFAVISIVVTEIKFEVDSFYSVITLIILLIIMNYFTFKKDISYTILITIVSLSISYTIYIISVMISFIPNVFLSIKNDYISLGIIIAIYIIIMNFIFRIKKFKYGIIFLQKNAKNEYFNMLILNICSIILFTITILQRYEELKTKRIGIFFIIFIVIMFITVKKSWDLHYKQTLLVKDLEETKKELKNKEKEIQKLEKENLKFGEISHTLAHKQKSLQYKIDEIIKKNENIETKEIKELEERVKQISKELYVEPKDVELTKTNITIIDDMLKYMQAECIKKDIKFDLQINGNIHYLVNNLIEKEKLEVLLADHIKDAIIAIDYSNNKNKSILVKLGKFDGIYSLYIYDSGIEFKKETLEKLGSKPITTHADNGGSGMGFMKTFNTLRECKASLIIEEYGKTCNENYTKTLIIKFDKKQEYKVISYRDISINKLIK